MADVFVTGGTGFVGKHVVRTLVSRGFHVRCLVRPGSEGALAGLPTIDRVPGDVLNPDRAVAAATGCAAIVHLVGIIRERDARGVTFERLHVEATRNMLAVAKQAGVRRYLQMSALGTRPNARSAYHRTKWQAEETVRRSDTEWTIFRPSLIYGRGDQSISLLADMVRRLPAVPVLGDGRYRVQPVAVEHVAEGFARAASGGAAVGQTYEVGGPAPYAFDDLLDLIGAAVRRRRVRKIHVPLGAITRLTRALEWLPFYPLTVDQITMLQEENVVNDPQRFYADFGITPEPLADGLRRLLSSR